MKLRERLGKWLLDAAMNTEKTRGDVLNAMAIDYGIIEEILERANEGCYVEVKLNNGTSIIVGKQDGKVASRHYSSAYY